MTQRLLLRSWPWICVIWAVLLLGHRTIAQVQAFGLPGIPGGATALQPMGELATVTPKLNFERVQPGQQVVVALVVDVQPGYHAQSHTPLDKNLVPFEVQKLAVEPGTAYEPIYPEGHLETYPALGQMSVYTGRAVIYIPVQIASDAAAGVNVTIRGMAAFQICDDQMCYQPEERDWELRVPVVGAGESVAPADEELFADFDPSTWSNLQIAGSRTKSTEDGTDASAGDARVSLAGWEIDLAESGIWLVLPLAFIAGIIFNIVPCVLPVLPLKAMGFYEVAQHNRAKCLALGVAFSLGIALTFATLAVLVLVLRWFDWGQLFSQPWFALSIGIILIVMALYQFGVLEFAVPQGVYAITPRHDTYTGNVLFGILTAILSTPCTFGLFAGLLVWALSQPAWIGVTTVTMTGIGMAFPYLVLSAFPEMARRLPRTGPWSELVKQAMGFLLLAIAAYFIRPLLPDAWRGPGYWWVIFGLIAAGGAYAGIRAVQIAPGRPKPILVTTLLSLIVLAPLAVITHGLANPPAGWVYYSPELLAEARASNRPVLVKFTADWCANCQTVEQTVFGTQEEMDAWRDKGLVLVKADLTKKDAAGWPLLRELHKVGSIPFTAVFLPGEEQPRKLPGIYGAEDVEAALAGGA